jgi:hypothetical protein
MRTQRCSYSPFHGSSSFFPANAAGFFARSDREGLVNRILPKQPQVRLAPELYELLREQVLRRDGWRCQCCGTRSNLEVHHKEFRSRGGDDSEQNLITLCVTCHSLLHCCAPHGEFMATRSQILCPHAEKGMGRREGKDETLWHCPAAGSTPERPLSCPVACPLGVLQTEQQGRHIENGRSFQHVGTKHQACTMAADVQR